jgi:hypothetical protein
VRRLKSIDMLSLEDFELVPRRIGGADLLEHLLDGVPHDACKRLV